MLVSAVQIVEHGFLQHSNGSVTASTDTALGHLGEQSFYEVQPASASGCEVNVVARVSRQPLLDFAHFMRAVIIHDQVNIEAFGQTGLNIVEEP